MKRQMMIFLLVGSSIFCFAARNSTTAKPIIIHGIVSKDFQEKIMADPFVYYYDEYLAPYKGNATKLPIKFSDREFTVSFVPRAKHGYFQIGNQIVNSIFSQMLLVEAGDNLSIQINSKTDIFFSGKGAEKMNLQFLEVQLNLPTSSKESDMSSFEAALNNSIEKHSARIFNKFDSIEFSYPETKEVMKSNITAFFKLSTIEKLSLANINGKKLQSTLDSIYIKELELLKYSGDSWHPTLMTVNYFYQLTKAHYGGVGNSSIDFPVELYDHINTDYSGRLRDKLLTVCIIRMGKNSPNIIEKIPSALAQLSDTLSIQILSKLAKRNLQGNNVFPFSFTDKNGKKVTSESLKGKLVILDTWFFGCVYCELLTEQMEPIARKFENNSDVIFLSINAVDNKIKFLNGVNSGKYGSKQSIYGHTDGLGLNHPFIKYYDYKAFPNLLIIGKDGKLISANPPRPSSIEKVNALNKLISDNL